MRARVACGIGKERRDQFQLKKDKNFLLNSCALLQGQVVQSTLPFPTLRSRIWKYQFGTTRWVLSELRVTRRGTCRPVIGHTMSVRDMLSAIIAGYECYGRVAVLHCKRESVCVSDCVWHCETVYGPIGLMVL